MHGMQAYLSFIVHRYPPTMGKDFDANLSIPNSQAITLTTVSPDLYS